MGFFRGEDTKVDIDWNYQSNDLVKFHRDLTRPKNPQKVAFWKGNGSPYFREI